MKKNTQFFIVEQKQLVAILTAMQPICNKRSPLDVTTSILFYITPKELIIKSTDLEISFQASCALEEVTITQEMSFLVPGKRLFDLVKDLSGLVTFELDGSRLLVKASRMKCALSIQSAELFPTLPEKIENILHCASEELLAMLEKVVFMIPQSTTTPALNGLFIEIDANGFALTATDGHCLSHVHNTAWTLQEYHSWLLPKRAVIELKKILETSLCAGPIFLGTCGNQIVFSTDTFNFFSKVLTDQYPQYKPILLHDTFFQLQVLRDDLVGALRRAGSLLAQQFIATKFTFDATHKTITTHLKNKEIGEIKEEVSLQSYTGENLVIYAYAPYIINGLQNIHQKNITMYILSPVKPLICTFDINEHTAGTYIIMPVSASANNSSESEL
jgi:DNA polymerase-3 subunit beta